MYRMDPPTVPRSRSKPKSKTSSFLSFIGKDKTPPPPHGKDKTPPPQNGSRQYYLPDKPSLPELKQTAVFKIDGIEDMLRSNYHAQTTDTKPNGPPQPTPISDAPLSPRTSSRPQNDDFTLSLDETPTQRYKLQNGRRVPSNLVPTPAGKLLTTVNGDNRPAGSAVKSSRERAVSPSQHITDQDSRFIPTSRVASPTNGVTSPRSKSQHRASTRAPEVYDVVHRPRSEHSSDHDSGNQRSQDDVAFTLPALPPLQPVRVADDESTTDPNGLSPIGEDDPTSWELVRPNTGSRVRRAEYVLERRTDQLYSADHLQLVLNGPALMVIFARFLASRRPSRFQNFLYYLDSLKALKAISYANSITNDLSNRKGSDAHGPLPTIQNTALGEHTEKAFQAILQDDLPAFVAYQWTKIVSASARYRITGTMPSHLRTASEGLAEVFCLSDPSQEDNPIVFVSEEFSRTTQYGVQYAVGRNCRFLQGPRTNKDSVRRISQACKEGREHTEVFLNYRRDGSPFMNLLMIAPLLDAEGVVRYFLGAQVDVSGLLLKSSQLDGLGKLVQREEGGETNGDETDSKDEFQSLCEMFNANELRTIRKYGGRMHQQGAMSNSKSRSDQGERVVLTDPMGEGSTIETDDYPETGSISRVSLNSERNHKPGIGRLPGVYEHYLLIRPHPTLRILFASPSLQTPGLIQSPFLDCIGGSSRVRDELASVLEEGRGVSAKIRWLGRARSLEGTLTNGNGHHESDAESDVNGSVAARNQFCWIHCTPMIDQNSRVGVWVVILVREDGQDV